MQLMDHDLKEVVDEITGNVSLPVPTYQGYDPGCGLTEGRNPPAWNHLPSGHIGLLDMINFVLGHFCSVLRIIWDLEQTADSQKSFATTKMSEDTGAGPLARVLAGLPNPPLDDQLTQYLTKLLDVADDSFKKLQLQAPLDRTRRFRNQLSKGMDFDQYKIELKYLREAIEDSIRDSYFFYYPTEKAKLVLGAAKEWENTLITFPSANGDIFNGVDCYAMEKYTASVFHMMRVAEIGMRALARERQVKFPKHPLEWADWQNILEEIEKRARAVTQGMPRGPTKDAMQAFYNGAVGQLHGFKDTYRNVVMHVRRKYDAPDALKAITQVCDFMNGLSVKIGEKTRSPIRRWP